MSDRWLDGNGIKIELCGDGIETWNDITKFKLN